MDEHIRTMLRLVLATGQRPGDVRQMAWGDLDIPAGQWAIPADKCKTGGAAPGPAVAPGAWCDQDGPADRKPFRLPHPGEGAGKLSADRRGALDHAVRRWYATGSAPDIPRRRPHDLRRTVRTQMARLGVPTDHAERLLGHAIAGVRGHYDVHDYVREKRRALDKWGRHVKGLVLGKLLA